MKSVCVYCSSSDRIDPKYHRLAAEVGQGLAREGWALVYGGGNTGSMGAVARATQAAGGKVIGVIPDFMTERELAFRQADELLTVTTMRERKQVMEERADAFLILPGGWGTLEEVMEILVLRQLDRTRKPCVLLNQDGFYDDLLRFFDRMIEGRFNRPSNRELFAVVTSVPAALEALRAGAGSTEHDWYVTR